jgi:hypothetical protein
MICSFCKATKTRSKTPCFAHLFAFLYIEFYGSVEITDEVGGFSASIVFVLLLFSVSVNRL